MTEEEIMDGNKIIAKFMGISEAIERTEKLGGSGYAGCNYYKSWNWIMPVVQKCCEEISKRPGIDARGGWTPENGYTEDIYTMSLNNPIKKVYKAVLFSVNKINKIKKETNI